jgi:2-succinyl-5-enolpyruvyl-6-hydroxy-3-cyclohexene-1-carboxylate synthase
MKYPKKELAQLILEYCIRYGIDQVVISPGSRNAPLTIGFVNHPEIKTYSIVDERCAAFFALGIAQQTRKPVAIVCTSGSALLNYYPAVAEAFYSNIPLIVISADRPKHLIDIGDGQTIRQENVFLNHSEFNANLDDTLSLSDNSHLVEKAFNNCFEKMGPVHINVPFDEPLYEVIDELVIKEIEAFKYVDNANKTTLELDQFAKIWNSSSRKMILVGENVPNALLQKHLERFTDDESVLVLTETTSNLHHTKFISSIDSLIFPLSEQQKLAFQPEVLITLGGMIVSKRIKKILRNYQPVHHWHLGPKKAPNTYHCLSHHFRINEVDFFDQFLEIASPIKSEYQQQWLTVKKRREEQHNKYISDAPFSDLKVFDVVLKTIPQEVLLQAGNSSVIRYLQLFKMDDTIQTFCNRGTSGIDGSTSTAIGASLATNKQTVFITGDISFFYDSNALWNKYIKNDFRIILINNSGGGIFKIIPGPQESNALDYFETTHDMNASHLCNMHGLEYHSASSGTALENTLEEFYSESNSPKLLEIFTPGNSNDIILKNYFKYLE